MLLLYIAMQCKSKLSLRQPFPTFTFGMMGVVIQHFSIALVWRSSISPITVPLSFLALEEPTGLEEIKMLKEKTTKIQNMDEYIAGVQLPDIVRSWKAVGRLWLVQFIPFSVLPYPPLQCSELDLQNGVSDFIFHPCRAGGLVVDAYQERFPFPPMSSKAGRRVNQIKAWLDESSTCWNHLLLMSMQPTPID